MTIPLTQAQYDAKVAQLKQDQGITLSGDSGTVSKLGVVIDYSYDGKDLTLEVKDKPFLISEKHIEAMIAAWLSVKPSTPPIAVMVAAVLLGMTLLFAPSATAQSVANIYMGGASYSAGASPAFAGTALYAHELNASGTYAFTLIDALPATLKPFTVTTNIGVGIGQKIATIDGLPIFVPTSAGISYSGSNTGWAWTTGAAVPFRLNAKSNWYIMPTVRVLKSSVSGGSGYQPILGVLVGWGQ